MSQVCLMVGMCCLPDLCDFITATPRRVPKMFPSGCRQRRLYADAADPYFSAWAQHCVDGKEHHDA